MLGSSAVDRVWTLQQALAHCEALTRGHYENFSVASRFFPRALLPDAYALYAFARTTDDLGDEAAGNRLALLDAWETEVRRCYASADRPRHPVTIALRETVARHTIPIEPLLALIEANRIDQRQSRFATYRELLHYCDHSANPVGRMVLCVFGYRDEERQALSDATCTALQLANFWQDVGQDYRTQDRIYLPLEDMARFGYSEADLDFGVVNNNFRELMALQVDRARTLFAKGAPLALKVEGVFRLDLRLFTEGGLAVLDAIERQRYDVLRRGPRVSGPRKALLLARTWATMKRRREL